MQRLRVQGSGMFSAYVDTDMDIDMVIDTDIELNRVLGSSLGADSILSGFLGFIPSLQKVLRASGIKGFWKGVGFGVRE